MERVVTINLNGNPYQLDEPAYDALRAYLGRAEAALASNPDKAEILRDLEQAIAEKCAAYLSAHKSVVAASEMTRILDEMGPVAGAEGEAAEQARPSGDAPRKRLYRIAEGSNIAGVCTGVAAFFDLDVNIVRLLFIVTALFTSGAFIFVYVAMMFFIPSAQTSEEWAAAHGAPFNAQEVIDRAKREYGRFSSDAARNWRHERRAWRRSMKEQARAWRHSWGGFEPPPSAVAPVQPAGYVTRLFSGLVAFVLSIVTAAMLIAFLIAVFSLLNTGAVLGWMPPADIPNWLAIVVLCIVYAALSSPLAYLRRGSYATATGNRYVYGGADGLVTMLAILAGGVIAYQLLPDFRIWIDHFPDSVRALRLEFRD
jgi:phage shock protein PspC (stress-responsive transcriptional regulator)